MLDNLLEIEIAYSMLRESVSSGEKDPLDVHYEKLRADIKVCAVGDVGDVCGICDVLVMFEISVMSACW